MASKKKGPGDGKGKVTSIEKAPPLRTRAKNPTTDPKKKTEKEIPDLVWPENLTGKVGLAALANGKYQRKILAANAGRNLPATINALHKLAASGNVQAIRLMLQMYSLVQQGGVNIMVQQNQQNNAPARISREESKSLTSFEEIARIVDSERRTRAIAAPVMEAEFEPTPED